MLLETCQRAVCDVALGAHVLWVIFYASAFIVKGCCENGEERLEIYRVSNLTLCKLHVVALFPWQILLVLHNDDCSDGNGVSEMEISLRRKLASVNWPEQYIVSVDRNFERLNHKLKQNISIILQECGRMHEVYSEAQRGKRSLSSKHFAHIQINCISYRGSMLTRCDVTTTTTVPWKWTSDERVSMIQAR
jgi:hypothetical protein